MRTQRLTPVAHCFLNIDPFPLSTDILCLVEPGGAGQEEAAVAGNMDTALELVRSVVYRRSET